MALLLAVGSAACHPSAGGARDGTAPAFPLRVDAARLRGTVVVVEYTLTNDSGHPVWAGCPEFECASPGLWAARFDGLSLGGTVVRLSAGLVAQEYGPFVSHPQYVPFRRVASGETGWRAEFDLTREAAQTIAEARGRVHVELSVGVLPCREPDLLPTYGAAFESTGTHVAHGEQFLKCGGAERRALELQQVTTGRRILDVVR